MEKVAIITGSAGNGIGRSTALTLARENYSVVINYKSNKNKADEICEYINKNGGKAIAVQANVFNKKECDLLINETIFNFGRIDVCIIGPGAGWNAEAIEQLKSEESMLDIIQEISPIYYLIPKIIMEMTKSKNGRIIGIASNKRFPSPSYSYNVAKNARIEAMLGLVNPCWKNRITVNVISPGPVNNIDNYSDAVKYVSDFSASPVNITPQDIAETIVFLCSEKGRFVTGNVIELGF